MTSVDETFDFIVQVFVQLTARDIYLIEREYNLNEEEHDLLIEKLGENGWTVEENGTVTK